MSKEQKKLFDAISIRGKFRGDDALRDVEIALENGADVNYNVGFDLTALEDAINLEDLDLVKLLVSKGANVNYVNGYGRSILEYASSCYARRKDSSIFSWLVENTPININQLLNDDGETIVVNLIKNGEIDLAKYLVSKGADVNISDSYGNTALFYAVFSGNLDLIKLVMEKTDNVNHVNEFGLNILSAMNVNTEMLLKLILTNNDFDITAGRYRPDSKNSILFDFIINRKSLGFADDFEVMKLLLERDNATNSFFRNGDLSEAITILPFVKMYSIVGFNDSGFEISKEENLLFKDLYDKIFVEMSSYLNDDDLEKVRDLVDKVANVALDDSVREEACKSLFKFKDEYLPAEQERQVQRWSDNRKAWIGAVIAATSALESGATGKGVIVGGGVGAAADADREVDAGVAAVEHVRPGTTPSVVSDKTLRRPGL